MKGSYSLSDAQQSVLDDTRKSLHKLIDTCLNQIHRDLLATHQEAHIAKDKEEKESSESSSSSDDDDILDDDDVYSFEVPDDKPIRKYPLRSRRRGRDAVDDDDDYDVRGFQKWLTHVAKSSDIFDLTKDEPWFKQSSWYALFIDWAGDQEAPNTCLVLRFASTCCERMYYQHTFEVVEHSVIRTQKQCTCCGKSNFISHTYTFQEDDDDQFPVCMDCQTEASLLRDFLVLLYRHARSSMYLLYNENAARAAYSELDDVMAKLKEARIQRQQQQQSSKRLKSKK